MNQRVIIAGAGPAGATAALCLARAGVACLLLDKARFPRDKLCGGFLSTRTLGLLRELHGPHLDETLFHSTDDSYELHHRGRLVVARSLGMPVAYVQRSEFDTFLVREAVKAGAVLREECKAESSSQDRDTIQLRTGQNETMRAEWVIAADGAMSRLRRAIDPAYRCGNKAFEVHAPSSEGVVPRLDFGLLPWGYAWSFPKRGCHTVGVFGQTERFLDPRSSLRDYLSSLGHQPSAMKGWPLPDKPVRPLARGRLLLAGDAGGLCEPISGEGLYYAIRSGQRAAQAILAAIRLPATFAALEARRSYGDGIGFILRQLQVSRLFRPLFYNPRRTGILLRAMAELPDLGEVEWSDVLRVTARNGLDLLAGED